MNRSDNMKNLPPDEQPYSKCMKYGVSSLTDAQLLAAVIRTGSKQENSVQLAQRILDFSKEHKGIMGLTHLRTEELLRVKGIGNVKAVQFQCIVELSRRMAKQTAAESLSFDHPGRIADYYMEDMRHEEREVLRLLMLNTKNRLIDDCIISVGTVNSAMVSPREIFIEAISNKAVFIILMHNHPSGDPEPSREDILLTRKIRECGELLEISLLDHIIIGDNKYVSFRERGLI